ncbi:hypothetical protein EC396_04270 [Lutibacter sp. HS1-25]|uniref:hypothetical protein n=1 Tax=Lutibacter sp. HS1-25 TaxID=2485000 RepID=UPI0010127592|nr:hypothetical protein [Lutibacter sp. HS1-25]RXP60875.1 hypothetical protein EC396_04270 [Lutibacter sp. HS1-25]
MKKIYIILFLITFTTNSFSQNFSTKNAGNCFSLEIPNYMVKTYDLNDVATLQYNNTVKEAYVIVIEDSKDELNSLSIIFQNPKEFLENFTKDYQLETENRTISEITEFESNENKHAQVELSWSTEDGSLYMLITTVETKEHFYKILCWTLLEYKDNLRDDYLMISKSLTD